MKVQNSIKRMFQKLNQKNRTDDMPSIFILIEKKVLNLDVVLIYLSFLLDWSNLGNVLSITPGALNVQPPKVQYCPQYATVRKNFNLK